jgi:hypothetical protein
MVDYIPGETVRSASRGFEKGGGTHFSFRPISTAAEWMKIDAPAFISTAQHMQASDRFARI